ncbi:hypothetical protein HSIEG1_2806 [Enterococcus sp. HSIEG1]|nr:hypothetical protein HSIEG1_2806 [Enterococcus sp. HSIEG1]
MWDIAISNNGAVTVDGQKTAVDDQVIQLTIENTFLDLPIAIRKYTEKGKEK